MSATINQCLAQLKSDMQAAWVTGSGGDGSVDVVYDYRTFPDKLGTAVSLSYQGGSPVPGTTGADYAYYDVTAVLGVQIAIDADGDITETALRNADQKLNTVEHALYALLGKGGTANRNSYWMKVSFPSPSVRPPQFPSAPTTRYAEIPFRLHIK